MSRPLSQPSPSTAPILFWSLGTAILCLAALLRLLTAPGDLWLDEILELNLARKKQSPWDVFFRLHKEVNHYLSTLTFMALGPQTNWNWYRVPPVIAGIGTVCLAGWQARRRNPLEPLLAMWITGTSYFLVHYSSECRGYSYLCFFSLAAFILADRTSSSHRSLRALGFGSVCLLGFLSHLSFVSCYGSLFLWTAYDSWRRHRELKPLLLEMLQMHFIPLAGFIVLYLTDIRYLDNIRGHVLQLFDVLSETFSLALGGPMGPWAISVALVSLAILITGVVNLYRQGDSRWLFFLLVTVPLPVAPIFLMQREEVYPRLFITGVLFLQLLAARCLTDAWQRVPRVRWVLLGLLIASATGNGFHIERLYRLGRGQYSQALKMIAAETKSDAITLASDHDFRNPVVLAFSQSQHVIDKPILYLPQDRPARRPPEWFIAHSFEISPNDMPATASIRGHRYARAGVFPYAGLSGWSWVVYHLEKSTSDSE